MGSTPIADLSEGMAIFIGSHASPNSRNSATYKYGLANASHGPGIGLSTKTTFLGDALKQGQSVYENSYATGGFLVKAVVDLLGADGMQKLGRIYEKSRSEYSADYSKDLYNPVLTDKAGQVVTSKQAIEALLASEFNPQEVAQIGRFQNALLANARNTIVSSSVGVETTVTVGADQDGNSFQVVDQRGLVSAHQASLIRYKDGSLRVVDYSTNGTYVNGVRVIDPLGQELKEGDGVTFGVSDASAEQYKVIKIGTTLTLQLHTIDVIAAGVAVQMKQANELNAMKVAKANNPFKKSGTIKLGATSEDITGMVETTGYQIFTDLTVAKAMRTANQVGSINSYGCWMPHRYLSAGRYRGRQICVDGKVLRNMYNGKILLAG